MRDFNSDQLLRTDLNNAGRLIANGEPVHMMVNGAEGVRISFEEVDSVLDFKMKTCEVFRSNDEAVCIDLMSKGTILAVVNHMGTVTTAY